MTLLHHDYETASELDLDEVGLENYSLHPSTRILMLAWAIDDHKVHLWEPHIAPLPNELRDALTDPQVTKCAFNAEFERTISKNIAKLWVPYEQWLDPLIWARHLSVTGDLETVGRIMGLRQNEAKLEEGQRLIQKFCQPETASQDGTLFGTSSAFFRDWQTDPDDWHLFGEYCKRDTEAQRTLLKRMGKFPLPEIEQRGWILDQRINDRGMPVDQDLVAGAIAIAAAEQRALDRQLKELTGLPNPNSRDQMLAWVRTQGYPFNALGKEEVTRALGKDFVERLTPLGKQVLELRQQAAKTSFKKYEAIRLNASPDGRLRHQFSFLGAPRAGRWAGHDVQLQNLPRPTKEVEKKMERAVELLRAHDELTLMLEFSSTMEVVASCVRSAFRASPGKKFVVCDLNAIENRVLGWVARCASILQVFADGKCPYLSFAASLFSVPYELLILVNQHGEHKAKDADAAGKRQAAKPAVLGAGYRLGGGEEVVNKDGDTIKTGLWGYAEGMGVKMTREEAHRGVAIFRETYPEVVQLWYDLEAASMKAVRTGEPQEVGPVRFECFGGGKEKKLLRILLPSGRSLHYIRPKIEKIDFRGKLKDTLTYDGIDQTTRQWVRVTTHGGKLTENIVQAISRDILLHGMLLAEEKGFPIVGHVHDEIIAEVEENSPLGLADLRECMKASPFWAPDLPLNADGYEGYFYKKG